MSIKKPAAVLLFVIVGWLAVMLNFAPFPGGNDPSYSPATLPSFVAPPTAGSGLRFAVIGDYGNASADEARVAALVAGWNPDFVITTGDNNYPDGEASTIDAHIGQYYSAFIGNYQGEYGAGSPVNRFWPSLGNHDWHTMACGAAGCRSAYLDYFTLPGNERYYAVDYGLVRLFALDSDPDEPDGVHADSAQARWLQGALAASDACFDVVYFHHPPYSSGKHGSTEHMRWPFAAWGADAVMAGHEHSYERVDVGGAPYFVNGLGGKSLYEF
uniref:metallophosphoesterase family protein n=1 Tax=Promineifilum sp. TaxID=2664178 RepID=UPI0035B0930A